MKLLISKRKMKQVMGINKRNLDYIYKMNPRSAFRLVDDKVLAKTMLIEAGINVPSNYAVATEHRDIGKCIDAIRHNKLSVVKPAQSFGGQGILVLDRIGEDTWCTPSGKELNENDIEFHVAGILTGLFTSSGMNDKAIVEERIADCDVFGEAHGSPAVSDIRIIVCDGEPIMSMLRLPTMLSGGRANLHAGGIGAGIDLETGETTYGVMRQQPCDFHPDTGAPIAGLVVPGWSEILESSKVLNRLFGMGYLGADFVVDNEKGPMILEVNARPGLDIQIANRKGLLSTFADYEGAGTS